MTKPTPAQIEAAQVAWQETARRTCSSNEAWKAALTAAQVGECKTCGGKGLVIQDAEWEPVAVRCPDPDCRAAAQVGEQPDDDLYFSTEQAQWYLDQIKMAKAATTERCAQVVERYAVNIGEMAFTISAELRKMKDAP